MDWRALPSLGALRAFAALARSGSFTAAGAALNVSHAAISQQVRALEDRLGATLLDRSGRRPTLTPEGRRLADALESAFAGVARAVAELTDADARRPLKVTLTPAFATTWLMPRLPGFLHENPGVDLMLNPTVEVVDMTPGGVDVAIRFGAGRWPGLDSALLLRSGFVVVAAPSLVAGRRVTEPADLVDLPWLSDEGREECDAWLRGRGVTQPLREALTTVPGYAALDAMRSGLGVAISARAVVADDIAAGRLVALFEEPPSDTGYYVVTRPGVLRPPARAFVAWLRRQAAG